MRVPILMFVYQITRKFTQLERSLSAISLQKCNMSSIVMSGQILFFGEKQVSCQLACLSGDAMQAGKIMIDPGTVAVWEKIPCISSLLDSSC